MKCPLSPQFQHCQPVLCPIDCIYTWSNSKPNNEELKCFTSLERPNCHPVLCPVDCVYTWSQWSECNATCGKGFQSRSVMVETFPSNEGVACPTSGQHRMCTQGQCPRDCEYTWNAWSACDKICGSGNQIRKPVIITNSTDDGKQCLSAQNQTCNENGCPVDCMFSWKQWSSCDATCGMGTRIRNISVTKEPANGGKQCYPSFQSEVCNEKDCPIDCMYTWQQWSACDKTCGDSMRTRIPVPINLAENGGKACPSPEFENCTILTWTAWSECSTTCGKGIQSRAAFIKASPVGNGIPCSSHPESKECDSGLCPFDCMFTWGPWDICSTICGKGTRKRNPVAATLSSYNKTHCPSNTEAAECDGNFCTLGTVPDGSKLMKLGSTAEGRKWAFDKNGLSGLGIKSPYSDANVAAAVLPDGTPVLVALNPEDMAVDQINTLCKQGADFYGRCPDRWISKGEVCFVLQKTATDLKCFIGDAVEANDTIMNNTESLVQIYNAGFIQAPTPTPDCKFTWTKWGSCDTPCGKGSKNRTHLFPKEATYNKTHCPKNVESTDCDGNACTLDNLPKGSELVKLGTTADGDEWPFNVSHFPGLGAKPPYPDAKIAAAVFPDGSSVYLPLDPVDPVTDEMNVLCKKDTEADGTCPDKWFLNRGQCFVLQKNGMCWEGKATEADDPIMNNPVALAQVIKNGPIDVGGSIDGNPADCWGPCSVTCGIGERHNIKKQETECSEMLDKQVCLPRGCPVDCSYEWGAWGICSASCHGGKQFRYPIVNHKTEYGGKECPTVQQQPCSTQSCPPVPTDLTSGAVSTSTATEPSAIAQLVSTTPAFPMSDLEMKISTIMQIIGCTFIISSLVTTLGVFLFLREFSHERFLHMNMEIALLIAHILVLTMRARTNLPIPCKIASIAFQFLFIVTFAFMALEALQAYTMTTMVITSGGYFSRLQFFIIGWGGSAIITAVSTLLKHNEYVSMWSCWTNLGDEVALATVVPILGLTGVTVVMCEAATMVDYPTLPGTNMDQATAALANSKGLLIILPASIASWFAGLFATYHANLGMYCLVTALNITLGSVIFIFHTLGNPKAHALLKKFCPKICCNT